MTFQKTNLISTEQITSIAQYFPTPKDFFSNFAASWDSVLSQVLKLETRQTYIEKGNLSYEAMIEGDFEKALTLIPEVRQADVDNLYKKLITKSVDFIRCRPVAFPLTDYLKWEFQIYKYNESFGEQIYCVEKSKLANIFENFALHDFMVFDYNKAFIHNYDNNGTIQGGWMIEDTNHIYSLIQLYAIIKAHTLKFSNFIYIHSSEL